MTCWNNAFCRNTIKYRLSIVVLCPWETVKCIIYIYDSISGACFRATNVFSFEPLFANNPFWCLNQKHVSNSRLGKTQPSHGLGYRKCNQIQDGVEDFILLQ